MRQRRLLPATALFAAALTALGALVAAPAQAAPIDYVALGDSYSSGTGAPGATGTCGRSPQGYPPLWATAHATTSFANATCAGAVTDGVLANQVQSLNAGTDVVTITIGGNDVGFANTMFTCALGSDARCLAAVQAATNDTTLPGKLDRTYTAIRAGAPAATVYVLGYPRLFEESSCPGGLSLVKRRALNQGADTLSERIQARAQAAGFRYVDVRPVFAGHGICSSSSWINGSLFSSGVYHPNATGYRSGYLAALNAATG